jgi:preprotein translocase subunit YajC
MLISTAHAQAAGGGGDMISALLPLVLIFAVFWFLVLRPQQKRMKDHKALVAGVKRGDNVVTGGGIHGKVTKVLDDETCQIEIADDVRIKVVKSTLQAVVDKTEPAGDAKKDAPAEPAAKKSLFSFGSKK